MGNHIIIKNVRCSFPQLYGPGVGPDGAPTNPNITVLLSKKQHDAAIKLLTSEIEKCIAENPKLKKNPPKGDKLCVKGSNLDGWRDEYEGYDYRLKASNKQPPVVLHKNMEKMSEADNKIYSGCYVNIKIDLWGQANQFGRRVNAKLLAVQFAGDGESFDSSYVSEDTAMKGFGSLDDGFDQAGEEPAEGGSLLD